MMEQLGSSDDRAAQPYKTDNIVPLTSARPATPQTSRSPVEHVKFDRRELDQLLRIYSFMVAGGQWRDYGISHLRDRAVFSVHRRASEMPLYRIEKTPKNARKQGAWSVITASGLIVKRGQDLATVLRVFDKHIKLVQSD